MRKSKEELEEEEQSELIAVSLAKTIRALKLQVKQLEDLRNGNISIGKKA